MQGVPLVQRPVPVPGGTFILPGAPLPVNCRRKNLRSAPVGLSNILNSEFRGGKPTEGPHGEVVGAAVVDGKLLCKVAEGIEAAAGVKAFLVFPVAAPDLPIVAGGIGPDELV